MLMSVNAFTCSHPHPAYRGKLGKSCKVQNTFNNRTDVEFVASVGDGGDEALFQQGLVHQATHGATDGDFGQTDVIFVVQE